jgi:hypothetical protein
LLQLSQQAPLDSLPDVLQQAFEEDK